MDKTILSKNNYEVPLLTPFPPVQDKPELSFLSRISWYATLASRSGLTMLLLATRNSNSSTKHSRSNVAAGRQSGLSLSPRA